MEQYLAYLLKSAAWLSAFIIIYLIFLRNEHYLRIKRWYLIAGILLSLVLPLIKFYYQAAEEVYFSNAQPQSQFTPGSETVFIQHGYSAILYYIIIGGTIALMVRLLFNTIPNIAKIVKKGVSEQDGAYFVKSDQIRYPFSFFNVIFLNNDIKEPERGIIVQHEMGHIRQYHWVDILIVELAVILLWANPFIWICSRLIRENHEYLADEEVLRQADPGVYKAILLNYMLKVPVFNIIQPFTYSLNKKRFDMMNKTDAPFRKKLKVLIIIPVLAMMAYAFSEPKPASEIPAFVIVEEMPMYPGGDTELMRYIVSNINYPKEAREQNIQGRVTMRFVVDKQGNVVQPEVLRGVDPLLDAEAIRVVSSIKGFIPGKQDGTPVGVYYMIPITFSLEGGNVND